MATYVLAAPYARSPLRRRVTSLALAVAINAGVILMLISLGIVDVPLAKKTLRGIVVDLIPEQQSSSTTKSNKVQVQHTEERQQPVVKPPPIILPVKPTIAPPPTRSKPSPWLEMSKEDMASSDISKIASSGSGSAGDSEVVGRGPNGEALYKADWAREPSNAELDGYLPHHTVDGFGEIECKTIPGNRVEDCFEVDQTPGSHLASAVRQAAWQFRVKPPRKGGRWLVGSWVRIRIDYIPDIGPNEDDVR